MNIRSAIQLVLVAVLMHFSRDSHALEQTTTTSCKRTDEQFARDLRVMNNWKSIYAVYKRTFPVCADDGYFAEGYSDVVVKTLANNWTDLRELDKLTRANSSFRTFVFEHIDATTSLDDLDLIIKHAHARCPRNLKQLCKTISEQANDAKKDAESVINPTQ